MAPQVSFRARRQTTIPLSSEQAQNEGRRSLAQRHLVVHPVGVGEHIPRGAPTCRCVPHAVDGSGMHDGAIWATQASDLLMHGRVEGLVQMSKKLPAIPP